MICDKGKVSMQFGDEIKGVVNWDVRLKMKSESAPPHHSSPPQPADQQNKEDPGY